MARTEAVINSHDHEAPESDLINGSRRQLSPRSGFDKWHRSIRSCASSPRCASNDAAGDEPKAKGGGRRCLRCPKGWGNGRYARYGRAPRQGGLSGWMVLPRHGRTPGMGRDARFAEAPGKSRRETKKDGTAGSAKKKALILFRLRARRHPVGYSPAEGWWRFRQSCGS